MNDQRRVILGRLPIGERRFLADALRQETVGGILLLLAALAGIVAANTALAGRYDDLATTVVGPAALGLDLPLYKWAGDGLLAIFFFIAGLELKRELVVGTLRQPSAAAVPVAAALAGMVVPAALYLAVSGLESGTTQGWGIPMATDIAFALAVLAVAGPRLPSALRAFLLTLAIVDDMGAITVIALFYTDDLKAGWLLAALVPLTLWSWAQHRRIASSLVYLPLALVTWWMVHESGVHATIAGVLLGLLVRVRPDPGEDHSPAEDLEHRLRPWSAGVAVPVFAFLSAGVAIDAASLRAMATSPIGQGIVVGLVVGKFVGVFGGAWLVARLTRAELSKDLVWADVAGVALVSGIGFTVSLLIADLAFEEEAASLDVAKAAILTGSVLSAVLAAGLLRLRNARYRALAEAEEEDPPDDADGGARRQPGPTSGMI